MMQSACFESCEAAVGSRRAESQRSADTGFDGKLTIHPDQIDVVNAAFSPTSKEVAEAQELLEAAKAQPGAFRFKGQMVTRCH